VRHACGRVSSLNLGHLGHLPEVVFYWAMEVAGLSMNGRNWVDL
jgi:hypothetical protein